MKRNITLDYTKLILSFLVIVIHNPIFWEFRFVSNLIVNGLCRIAVPCFFVINGLYLSKTIANYENFKKYTKRLLTFYFTWMLIYSPFYFLQFKDSINISILTNITNILFGFWHLWYIIGLLGGVAMLFFLKKKEVKDSRLLIIAFVLFTIGWMIQKVELFYPNVDSLIGGIIRSSFPSRNFIFMGFPFITIGYLMSKESFMKKYKKQLSNIYIVVLFLALLFLESIIHFYTLGRRGFDFYYALILLCPTVVAYILNKSKTVIVESDYISKLSAAIYFIHPLVLFIIKGIFPDLISTQRYVLIVLFSIIFGSSLIGVNKRLKIFF